MFRTKEDVNNKYYADQYKKTKERLIKFAKEKFGCNFNDYNSFNHILDVVIFKTSELKEINEELLLDTKKLQDRVDLVCKDNAKLEKERDELKIKLDILENGKYIISPTISVSYGFSGANTEDGVKKMYTIKSKSNTKFGEFDFTASAKTKKEALDIVKHLEKEDINL